MPFLRLASVLGTASQLRLPSFPLGIGEACLVLWLGLASLHLLVSSRIYNPQALLWLVAFWGCFVLIQSFGGFLALLRPEIVDPELVVHDIFAYLLVAALTCLVAATLRPEDTLRQSLWFLIGFWIVAVAVQLALRLGLPQHRVGRSMVLGPVPRVVGRIQTSLQSTVRF